MKKRTFLTLTRTLTRRIAPCFALLWTVASGQGMGHAEPVAEKAPEARAAKANPWEKEIRAFEAADKQKFPPADAALFIGSSSIRMWKTLGEDFPEIPTIRRGFGGSNLTDSVYFADRIAIPYKPRIIVVYAGSNDLNGRATPEDVLQSFQEFVKVVNAALPATRIAFISVNPSLQREKGVDKVRKANGLIEAYVRDKKGLAFINSFDGLLGPDGRPQAALLRPDGLHLNAEGYKKWVELVKPAILELYRAAAPEPTAAPASATAPAH